MEYSFKYPAWNEWNEKTKWTVLDYRSGESMMTRLQEVSLGPLLPNKAQPWTGSCCFVLEGFSLHLLDSLDFISKD